MENKKIVANLKDSLSLEDTKNYVKELSKLPKEIILCPGMILFPYFLNQGYKIGVQNVAMNEHTSYTGEVKASLVSSIGGEYALLGHSERRYYFHETDEEISKKIKCALEHHLHVIFCIGEEKKEDPVTLIKNLERQIYKGLQGLSKKDLEHIWIAYEPFWSIGSGQTPSKEEIKDIGVQIKEMIKNHWNVNIPFLYGGSLTEEKAKELASVSEIDGFLIGKASSDIKQLLKIIEVAV